MSSGYVLPGNADDLHRFPRYEQKDGFRRFLADMKERDSGMYLLRRWVFDE
jgi:hypothetical protein